MILIKKLFALILSLVLITSCNSDKMNSNKTSIPIIPLPKEVKMLKGNFQITPKTKILSVSLDDSQTKVVNLFAKQLCALTDLHLSVSQESENSQSISFSIDNSISNPEGYSLTINSQGINIKSATSAGLFYGAQSLLQLIPVEKRTDISVPAIEIVDEPRFKWRGMHLDESRHFFGVDFVKTMIDQMSILKMNTFHWHIVDDQGWRIEIKKYPKLTEIGAWRLDNENGVWNYSAERPKKGDPKYGGFYTQEEIKEIVAYAAARSITIVPEIEMPGHATAMIWSYPELSCKGETWGMEDGDAFEFSDPLCAGNEKTFEILEDVLTEVIDLFPSKYIHIGGDECKKEPWGECPKCKKRIRDENLKDLDELQSYFIKRIEKFILSKGRVLIGWDEILEGGLAPEAAVMSWRGYVGGIEAAEQGHEVVMSPTSFCYFDYYQGSTLEEPKAIGGFLPLSKVYDFDPIPQELSEDKHHLILGGQGNIWTEHMFISEDVEYMTYPRIFAMAEVLWTQKNQLDYKYFLDRTNPHYIRLVAQGVSFRMPIAEGLGDKVLFESDTSVTLFNPYSDKEAVIRYTVDGSNPDENSPIYKNPIDIKETTCLKAKIYYAGKSSNVALSWFFKFDPEKNGLNCEYYEGHWKLLPDFDKLTPVKTLIVSDVTQIVPGCKDDDYGLRLKGFLEIDEEKEYEFYTSSDDGSRLYINGKTVVDNDGKHGANLVSGKVKLTKGKHEIEIIYFEETGGEYLEVGTLTADGEKIPLKPSKFFFK